MVARAVVKLRLPRRHPYGTSRIYVARPSRCEAPLRLRPATFRYRQEASDTACRGLRYGLIAEEVAELLPMSSSADPTARWKASTTKISRRSVP